MQLTRYAVLSLIALVAACGGSDAAPGPIAPPPPPPPPAIGSTPVNLSVAGRSPTITDRFTAEVWVRGNVAYTTTWGLTRPAPGNAIFIWDVSGAQPRLADSVIVPGVSTIGDVQTSDDGKLLVVCTEHAPGQIVVFDLTNPFKPVRVGSFTSPEITRGVHTAEVQRVNGTLYAFLSVNRGTSLGPRLIIVDLSNPSAPTEVLSRAMGSPGLHDVFVRDGYLFTAQWGDGMTIWDMGGGGNGSVANPRQVGNIRTVGGDTHNIWWYHDGQTGSKRYAFVGEEDAGQIGLSSAGDIHVVDITNMAAPVEVAFYRLPGAGTHNFSVDEARGYLYAAYYNGGVQVLDVRGDLSQCVAAARAPDGRCDLEKAGRLVGRGLMEISSGVFIWGVHFAGSHVYASDMLTGLWKLNALTRP